ncbi:hypothetical protein JCGZ_04327 [Jatropha curcas]|uniref:Protein OSB1, mitochondrial n=1 Tax=Jatropha curcas TaxID=180498 RepID=A0A067KQI8_JATCU|nr:protein OSB1, mitochondrial [Jatropha curcas]KDP38402.1 hypothetical protein JCGZ_04327 [Jatropha curcas]
MNKACRLEFLIRNVPRSSLQRRASSCYHSAANPKSPNFTAYEDEVEEGGYSIYRHVLRRQRPTTIVWQPQLENSVSFIGRVDRLPELYKTKSDSFGAYTFINVGNPSMSNCTFRIKMDMWGDMAKTGLQYLKQNDTIYVSGHLRSEKKADQNGNLRSLYKIIVKELNYVAQHEQGSNFQKSDESQLKAFRKSEESQSNARKNSEKPQSGEGETGMESCTDRFYLWQMFFCKPHEWWDKRKNKQNSSAPDFKHKFTGEKLWLKPDDPPWVKQQLQLLDMEIAKQRTAQGIGETNMDRHHLWQVFFNNPQEWWDNRKDKRNSRAPDFKHKDTGEALWLRPDDPPWIKRQLQFLDSLTEQCQGESIGSCSHVSQWRLDD